MTADPESTEPSEETGAAPSGGQGKRWDWELFAKIATAVMPLVVAVVGFFIARSITRIEVAPRFIELAMEIIAEDPRNQPEGVREWAVDLLVEHAGVDLDPDLTRRIEAGWNFQVPVREIGHFRYDARRVNRPTIDGHRFRLRFGVPPDDPGRLEDVELSLAASGEVVARERLDTTGLMTVHAGPVAYLFQLDSVEGPIARFRVWEQSPFLGRPALEVPAKSYLRESPAGAGESARAQE